MKTHISEFIFDHPWDKVSQGVFRKYPNPHKPEVMGTEVLEREVINGKLISQRLITSQFGIPSWSRKLLGSDDVCYGYEVSEVDPEKKTLTMKTKNITFSSAVTLDEQIVYKSLPPTPENPNERTSFTQKSIVTVHNIPFAGSLENFILSTMKFNSHKGRDALEWVMHSRIGDVNECGTIQTNSSGLNMETSVEKVSEIDFKKTVDEFSDKAKRSVDEFSDKAKRSVDELSGKALKSVDQLSDKAMKSVDEIGKAIKSVDEIGKAMKSVDELSGKALKSVDELSDKAMKSVDELGKAIKSVDEIGKAMKSVDELSDKAKRSVDEFGKAIKSVDEFSGKAVNAIVVSESMKSVENIRDNSWSRWVRHLWW